MLLALLAVAAGAAAAPPYAHQGRRQQGLGLCELFEPPVAHPTDQCGMSGYLHNCKVL